MSEIIAGGTGVTLINVFTVAPDQADQLIYLLDTATNAVIQHQPGFISANIHKSVDGTRVVNYAQWRSKEDLDAMYANPEAAPHMEAAAAIAERFEPMLYHVVAVHDR